jgi:hypothetical protein
MIIGVQRLAFTVQRSTFGGGFSVTFDHEYSGFRSGWKNNKSNGNSTFGEIILLTKRQTPNAKR